MSARGTTSAGKTMESDRRYLDPRSSRAVLIGTSRYDVKGFDQLGNVRNNVRQLARILRDSRVWGLAEEHCTTVEDPTSSKEILDAIKTAASAATGTLLVYYAGHGFEAQHNQELCLTHSRSMPGEPSTALNYSLVREAVLFSPAANRLVILDCCQAGLAIPAMGETHLVVIDRTFVMCAVGRYKRARARDEHHRYTTYTGALIRALDEGSPDLPERLAPEDLHQLVQTDLVSRNKPRPVCALTGNSPNLPLFRNQASGAVPPARKARKTRRAFRPYPEILISAGTVGAAGVLIARQASLPAHMSVVTAFAGAVTTIGVAMMLRRRTRTAG